jgi:glucuronokinase
MSWGSAFARAALAGNPSDGYGGATLAVEVRDYRAEVEAVAGGAAIEPHSELIAAAVRRFSCELEPRAGGTAIRWRTSIPRAVGLGGSSAIVVATLRALCELWQVEVEPVELAELALAVEVHELGIAAGLQDRVAQSFGGLTFMDFGRSQYESLHPGLLPPLFLAWRAQAAGDSDAVHRALRARHARGEQPVLEAMVELAELAFAAREALVAGDHARFARSVDESFNVRRRIMTLDPLHVEMVDCARALGASANNAGSGGAIVGTCDDRRHRVVVLEALERLGCIAIAPTTD